MMYNGSSCDSGQMANGQSVCRPTPGPTANWLETQSKQQQQQKEDGEPVAVRVMTNGTGAPSERSDNYIGLRPIVKDQPEPISPAHLAFLYDRSQQPVKSPSTEMAACPNGLTGMTSPHSDAYRSLPRAVPAPVHQRQQQQPSTGVWTSTEALSDYNPFNRATPAPIQQHAAAGAQHTTTISSASADAGTPTSPRVTQPSNAEPHTAEVSRQLSQLGVAGREQPSQRTSAPFAAGSGPFGNHRAGRTARQPPPIAFSRRQSAPGPIGQAVEPGSRKPWSYTPSFGVGCGSARVAPICPRPIMQPTSQNGTYKPRVRAAEGFQSNGERMHNADCSSQASGIDTSPNVHGDAVDSASIRYKLREGEEEPVVDYDETSIRYRGRANPSKTFRLLQSATGSDSDSDSTLAYATSRRPRRRQPSREVLDEQLQQSHADDIVDISYVGANIPSRRFRILQEAVGVIPPQENGSAQSGDVSGSGPSLGSGRNIRVIHLRPMKKHASVDNIVSCSDL